MSIQEAQTLPLDLGQQMANARKRTGLTQTQLGARWNEHRTTISRWERGDGEPSFSQMVDLSNLSGWPLELFARAATAPDGPDTTDGERVSPTRWYGGTVTELRARRLSPRPMAA